MFYARLEDDTPVEWGITLQDLRARLPNVSISPINPPTEIGEYVGYQPVDAPTVDITKNVTEGPPVFEDGQWVMNWVITDASPEEIEERQKVPVPESVPLWKAKAIMAVTEYGEGTLLDTVNAIMAEADAPTRIWWEYGLEIERYNPKTIAFASTLGIESQLDDLFIAANAIELT